MHADNSETVRTRTVVITTATRIESILEKIIINATTSASHIVNINSNIAFRGNERPQQHIIAHSQNIAMNLL